MKVSFSKVRSEEVVGDEFQASDIGAQEVSFEPIDDLQNDLAIQCQLKPIPGLSARADERVDGETSHDQSLSIAKLPGRSTTGENLTTFSRSVRAPGIVS